MQQQVRQKEVNDVNKLKQRLIDAWDFLGKASSMIQH